MIVKLGNANNVQKGSRKLHYFRTCELKLLSVVNYSSRDLKFLPCYKSQREECDKVTACLITVM